MTPNACYVVIEEGVYRHRVWGPFSMLWDAKEKADKHANSTNSDGDGWHEYVVYLMERKTPGNAPLNGYGTEDTGRPLYSARGTVNPNTRL